jgi:DNA topoisomerase-2
MPTYGYELNNLINLFNLLFLIFFMSKKYIKLTPIEHILKRPNMYIGEISNKLSKEFILESNIIIEKEINYNPGLYKLCDELIVNSYDASINDKTLDNISINLTKTNFKIFNSGIGIPIEKHPEYKIYTPELIFANLLTSSNFSDTEDRITGGLHGLGSKLSAIFSKKFIVNIWYKKLHYKQIYENNLSIINKPEINKNLDKNSGVSIEIIPDFEKFGVTEFSEDMIKLISRRVYDLTCLVRSNITIELNNNKLQTGFNNYLNLYASTNKWILGNCIKNNFWYFAIKFNNNLEQNHHISFVNSIFTSNGGTHLDYLFDLLLPKFQKLIDNNINKKFLKDNLTICLVTSINNPTFNSQSKETLVLPSSKFGFTCSIGINFFDKLKESELLIKLKEINNKINLKQLGKFDGTKKKKIIISKLEDANLAGTKKSENCVLILTEGDSAKATAISGISAIKNGRDFFGVFPLRGKLLNVREATTSQINNNQEIIDIKKILGLKSGINYTKDNINELRYGSILLMMDADEDGSHIKGLIINFLNYFFPSLLKINGFLKVLMTPIVKIFLKNNIKSFSNLRSYNNWLIKNPGNYKIKYYKGLGTSTSQESKEYFTNLENNIVQIIDKNNEESIKLAFAKDKINDRKQWLINYNPKNILQIEPPTTINIDNFINQELIHFSNYDNIRSIPLLVDGFKPSQRKVLYACLKKNLKSEMKVAQLASYVAEVTSYHHGEQSLVGTIINMAQDFIGSNNLNLLIPAGQMGTRLLGGKDHASGRYIFTYLNKITEKIFIKDDNELLEYLQDDGEQIEPLFYLPIIPMILVNGSEGIGTGFSTFIPNYNVKDIINWYIDKLNNKKTKELLPKVNNFKGQIFKYDDTTFISLGLCKIEKDIIIINELPIKLWTSVYKEILDEFIEDGIIKSYINYSSDIEIYFELKVNDIDYIKKLNETIDEKGLNNLYKLLKLYKTIKISNLTLYDTLIKLKTFNNIEEICLEFYKFRLVYYQKRKDLLLTKYSEEINYLTNQINFINLVKTNSTIFNLEEEKIIDLIIKKKIKKYNDSYDYLINMSFKQLSITNLNKLNDKIKELKNLKKKLEIKTPKDIWLNDLDELNNVIIKNN